MIAGPGAVLTRRALVFGLAAWQAQQAQLPAHAEKGGFIRGAEDAYATQRFEEGVCQRRTALGACAEQSKSTGGQRGITSPFPDVAAAPKQLTAPEEPESELIKNLLARSEANKEKNAREVQEKTIKNGMDGQFGPFAKNAPVMKADGSFDIIPLAKYDKYKDKKKIVVSKTGLDTWVEGFDYAAAEEEAARKKAGKFLGLF